MKQRVECNGEGLVWLGGGEGGDIGVLSHRPTPVTDHRQTTADEPGSSSGGKGALHVESGGSSRWIASVSRFDVFILKCM